MRTRRTMAMLLATSTSWGAILAGAAATAPSRITGINSPAAAITAVVSETAQFVPSTYHDVVATYHDLLATYHDLLATYHDVLDTYHD